jgi:hypothetical protein
MPALVAGIHANATWLVFAWMAGSEAGHDGWGEYLKRVIPDAVRREVPLR